MSIESALADALDETVRALAILDLDALTAMVERLTVLAQSTRLAGELGTGPMLAKKRVLELVLNHSETNLNALQRLYGRNTRDLWEH